jgi:hypothetical protein
MRDSRTVEERSTDIDPRKVRVGLAVVALIFVASVVLFFVVDDPLGRAIFFAVGVVCLVRVGLLARWVRRGGNAAPPA